MKASRHILASFSLGVLFWLFTKHVYASMVCFLSGVLIDIDHAVEFIIHYGWRKFSIKRVLQACEETVRGSGNYRFKRLYLIFHASEIAVLLWIISISTKNIYALALTVGYTAHLIMDISGNILYPNYYFFLWRAIKAFDTDKFLL